MRFFDKWTYREDMETLREGFNALLGELSDDLSKLRATVSELEKSQLANDLIVSQAAKGVRSMLQEANRKIRLAKAAGVMTEDDEQHDIEEETAAEPAVTPTRSRDDVIRAARAKFKGRLL